MSDAGSVHEHSPRTSAVHRAHVVLDLGTSRTRSLSLDGFAIADRPTAVVVPSPESAAGVPVRPVRRGMVVDPGACLRLVHLVLQDAWLSGGRPLEHVMTAVPRAATGSDRQAVRAAVAEAAGCQVTLVEAPLAAAAGAGLDVAGPAPYLLLDVGAGIVEAVVVVGGAVSDAAALQLSATTSKGLLPDALDGVVEMTAGLLRRQPAHLRPAVRENGLTVTGGGALQTRLLDRLHTALRIRINAAPEPQHATVRGLLRLCLRPTAPVTAL
ncbi:rod shape-determining protein [Nonomuraea sp. NPDC049607]|uniref:rod shape-determining protein n=1 Tax=Nonomuraea sp. NPDC049607 TaxID=3154732 RepID=UPI0034348468